MDRSEAIWNSWRNYTMEEQAIYMLRGKNIKYREKITVKYRDADDKGWKKAIIEIIKLTKTNDNKRTRKEAL